MPVSHYFPLSSLNSKSAASETPISPHDPKMPPASAPITWPIVSLRASSTDELAAALASLRAAHPNLIGTSPPNQTNGEEEGFIMDPETGIHYIIRCPASPPSTETTKSKEREQRYQSICRKRDEWDASRGREHTRRDRSASPRRNDSSQVGWDQAGYPVWPGETFPKGEVYSEESSRLGLPEEGTTTIRVDEWVRGVVEEGVDGGKGDAVGRGRRELPKRTIRRPERYRD
ncbi:MAG: hypothetical protein Q9208_002895 [Pyrenodesmia sp. 3 TL-2023]